MSIMTLILGESGTGKSTSLRNMGHGGKCLLIRSRKKRLPFPSPEWEEFSTETEKGNIFTTDSAETVVKIIRNTKRKIIVLDDFQYVMANEFMRRSSESGFTKFTEIGRHAWDVISEASEKDDETRIYFMWHPDTDNTGKVKAKTIGKMLEEKITVEGMFLICLRTHVEDGVYSFMTQSGGNDPAKSPMGMFDFKIPNDLEEVDKRICEYYSIER